VLVMDPEQGRSGRVCAPVTKLGRLVASRVLRFHSHCNAPHLVHRVEDRFCSPLDLSDRGSWTAEYVRMTTSILIFRRRASRVS